MAASGDVARVGAGVVSVPACPSCASTLSLERGVTSGYCSTCGNAWLLCPSCNDPVSTLSRHCPRDGRRVDLSASPVNNSRDLRVGDARGDRFEFHECFQHAPRELAGYLWLLSDHGNLYRFAPPGRKVLVENLRSEYGVGPFEVVSRGVSARTLVAAAARHTIAVLDPAVHQPSDEPQCSPTLQSVRGAQKAARHYVDLTEGASPTIAYSAGSFAAIAIEKQDSALAVWSQGSDAVKLWPLRAEALLGPFTLGPLFCACSARHLHWLDGTSVSKMPLPPRFEPLDPRSTVQRLRPPWGRPMFVQTLDGVYIAGHLGGRPSFLFAELAGDKPAMALVATDRLQGDESYGPTAEGQVIVAGRSGLHLMMRTTLKRVPFDVPGEVQSGPAVVVGRSCAAVFKGTHGALEIRVHPDGTRLEVPPGHEIVELHLLPGYLAATLVSLSTRFLTVVTWPLAS